MDYSDIDTAIDALTEHLHDGLHEDLSDFGLEYHKRCDHCKEIIYDEDDACYSKHKRGVTFCSEDCVFEWEEENGYE